MKNLYKLERKYGKYAIKNLPLLVVVCFALGYIFYGFAPGMTALLDFSPPEIIYGHQYWRLFTWVLSPAGGLNLLSLLMLLFYYSFAKSIEQGIGTFFFNLYIFGGWFFSTIVALGVSIYFYFRIGDEALYTACFSHAGLGIFAGVPAGSPMMSIMEYGLFLGFALVFSDAFVMLYFVLPFKASWIAYLDMIFLAYEFVTATKNGAYIVSGTIVGFLLNFFLFYVILRKAQSSSGRTQNIARKRRQADFAYRREMNPKTKQNTASSNKDDLPEGISKHKCAICGRTEKNSDLEFRFCSKCKGNYEYCNEHLFTHEHVK